MDSSKKAVVQSSTCVYEGKYSLVEDVVTFPNGHTAKHLTFLHPGAVVILPITAEGKIVLVRQYRHAVKRWILELPAGTLGKDEDAGVCAKRELAEEIGFQGKVWHNLGAFFPAPGFCNEEQHFFVASDLYQESGQKDEDECIEVEELSVSEFEEAITGGEITDSKSLALFCRARLAGLI